MINELATVNKEIISSLILNGDISKLNNVQRVEYVTKICERVGVDPLTQPFKIMRLQGKETLYADKGCAQQLCHAHKISTEITSKEKQDDVYVVTVRAKKGDEVTDEIGAVTIANLKGEALANAMMKACTKAKRRAVLALCGLGMLDETEVETIPNAQTKPIIQNQIESAKKEIVEAETVQFTIEEKRETIKKEMGLMLEWLVKYINEKSKKDFKSFDEIQDVTIPVLFNKLEVYKKDVLEYALSKGYTVI